MRTIPTAASGRWAVQSAAPVALVLCAWLVPATVLADADAEAGQALARQVYDRDEGSDVSTRALMVLTGEGRATRQREFYSFAKDKGGAERWTLMRFVSPADIEGTAVLTLDHPGDESDQWLYLPALKKSRRISSSRKGGRFVGSDLFFEDLRDREVQMDSHRLLGKAKVSGIDCELLESIPVERGNSVYAKRVSCINRRTLLPLRVDYYRRGGKKPFKRLKVTKIKKIDGYWTVLDSQVLDLKSGSKTRTVVRSIKYDQGLPDDLFTKRGLKDRGQAQVYRP